jgi:hypothetical protein
MARARSALSALSRKYWWIVGGLIPVWMGFVGLVGPWVIGELHAGRGPGFLVAQLAARDRVPLSDYLWVWGRAMRSMTFFLVLLVVAGYVALRLVEALREPSPGPAREESPVESFGGADAAA